MALTGDWQVLNGITRSLKLSLRSCGSSLWHSGRWLSLMPVSCKEKAAWFFHSQKKRDSWFGKMDQTSATKNGGSRMWTHQTREINQKMPTTSSEDFGIWTDGRFWFSRSWRLQDQREVSYSRFFCMSNIKNGGTIKSPKSYTVWWIIDSSGGRLSVVYINNDSRCLCRSSAIMYLRYLVVHLCHACRYIIESSKKSVVTVLCNGNHGWVSSIFCHSPTRSHSSGVSAATWPHSEQLFHTRNWHHLAESRSLDRGSLSMNLSRY